MRAVRSGPPRDGTRDALGDRAAATAEAAGQAACPLRVLVVDDLVLLRRMLARQLAAAGHAVVGEAGTAAEAVARARALAPDVLVLDVHLPDGLGTEVAALVAGGPAPAPAVVFCTGDPAHAAIARAVGAWPVLEKPAPLAALDGAVREAARRRRVCV